MAEGYLFEFRPCKQRSIVMKNFLVPLASLEYEIFHTYKSVVEEELEIGPEDRLWLCGVKESNEYESYFKHSPIGIKEIRKIPRFIAEFLGYDQDMRSLFTGHSFRHSGSTWLSNAGVSIMTLQKKLNHKNPSVS